MMDVSETSNAITCTAGGGALPELPAAWRVQLLTPNRLEPHTKTVSLAKVGCDAQRSVRVGVWAAAGGASSSSSSAAVRDAIVGAA